MVFNSLLLLAETNRKGVFNFLKELFYVNNYELSVDEKAFIYNCLIEHSKSDNKNYKDLLERFSTKKDLYKILSLLGKDEKYGFFTNREKVYITNLDKKALKLTISYLNIFGFGNVQN